MKPGRNHEPGRFSGNWFILYFYPKDNTSACTAEAVAFSGVYEELAANGIAVIGISPDTPASHRNFREKHDLKVILLSDGDHRVCEAYDVWKKKKMYGKEYMGVDRSMFLVDPDGIIRSVWRSVRVPGHVEAVLGRLAELQGVFKKKS
jgi:peroxiredoxin Q/BCP